MEILPAKGCRIRTVQTRTHQALFPILRRLSDGKFHSGEALAQEFDLSRSSIFNALAEAEAMGLTLHAVRGRGYRLPEPVDWLDAEGKKQSIQYIAPNLNQCKGCHSYDGKFVPIGTNLPS